MNEINNLLAIGGTCLLMVIVTWYVLSYALFAVYQARKYHLVGHILRRFATPRIRRATVALMSLTLTSPTVAWAQPDLTPIQVAAYEDPASPTPVSLRETPVIPEAAAAVTNRTPNSDHHAGELSQSLNTGSQSLYPALALTEAAIYPTASTTVPAEITVIVRPADTLWGIVHTHFPDADDAALVDLVLATWQANRQIIGEDPNLILPGQELTLPHR
ncbi:MAG: hypothetical protein GX483_08530 [Actinomycetaceae bacterium]|nr:hypothetical protein [Actinomycetaceae bacterium]